MSARDLAPGPWRVEPPSDVQSEDAPHIVDAHGRVIAWISARLNIGDESWRAIAAELAAAREMREALKLAEEHIAETLADPKWHPIGDCPVLRAVRAALAKAAHDGSPSEAAE